MAYKYTGQKTERAYKIYRTVQKEYIDSPLTIGFYYGSTEKYNVNHI